MKMQYVLLQIWRMLICGSSEKHSEKPLKINRLIIIK